MTAGLYASGINALLPQVFNGSHDPLRKWGLSSAVRCLGLTATDHQRRCCWLPLYKIHTPLDISGWPWSTQTDSFPACFDLFFLVPCSTWVFLFTHSQPPLRNNALQALTAVAGLDSYDYYIPGTCLDPDHYQPLILFICPLKVILIPAGKMSLLHNEEYV